MIEYNHFQNLHTDSGPITMIPIILRQYPGITSILDIGCGQGKWMYAAEKCKIDDVFGVDGVDTTKQSGSLLNEENFKVIDLTMSWNLKRKFDMALCLEVAEHIDEKFSDLFVKNICAHTNLVLFSAAIPKQSGQNHVNCQWPEYWQKLFNDNGFSCDDSLKKEVWDLEAVEPWYRQNIFVAKKSSELAGNEARLRRVIHPDMLKYMTQSSVTEAYANGWEESKSAIRFGKSSFIFLARAFLSKLVTSIKKPKPR